MSTIDPVVDEVSGAINQLFFLIYQIFEHLNFEQQKNAIPEPRAILIEIKSEKFVEINNVKIMPTMKPK